jgi:ribulose-5-phosphate 4-epimerase/fuculose-1-phosphate aldolase
MGKSCVLIMQGHGANVTGRTIQEACLNAVHLERTAKLILRAGRVGRFSPVTATAVKKFHAVEAGRLNVGRPGPPRSPEWNYYESMIKRGERWNTW